jgi:phytoene dehydrogenase-like protein
MKDKKVIIVGAGIGGAGLAALLAKDGVKPIVFERNAFVGGKAGSIEHEGCLFDVGVHISARGEKGPLAQLARKVGADVGFINKSPLLRLNYGGRDGLIYQKMTHPVSLYNIYRIVRPSIKSLLGMLRIAKLVYSIKTKKDAAPYYHIPAKSIIVKYMSDPDMQTFLDICCNLMFGISTDEASAGDFLLAFNNWITSGATAYPKGGYGAIPKAYMKACEDAGGELHLNEKVNRIIAEEGAIKGVETDKGFYPADIIISNAGVVRTLEMAGDQHFPGSYVEKARNAIDSVGGVMVKYILDAPLVKIPMSLYTPRRFNVPDLIEGLGRGRMPDDMALFIVSPTATEPGLAPEGLHLLYGGTVTPARLDRDISNAVMDRVENRLEKLHPGLKEHIVWKERSDTDVIAAISGREQGDAIGMAQRYDQDGDKRFSPRSPLKGLYIVGADTGSFGIGTELAAQSAMETHALILEDTAGVHRAT